MTDDELRDTIRRGKPISAKRAEILLERAERAEAEQARLRTDLDSLRASYAQQGRALEAERRARHMAEADVGWWHATVSNYVTSATAADCELLRDTLAEATTYPHPGAALLTELDALRDALIAWINADGTLSFLDADETLADLAKRLRDERNGR